MNPKREQRIAYDFDNTLTRSPGPLGCFATASGTRSYIITGRPEAERPDVLAELEKMGIDQGVFDEIICYPVDYTMSQFDVRVLGSISEWKAHVCKRLEIDILFEDNILVVDPIKKISPNTLVSILI